MKVLMSYACSSNFNNYKKVTFNSFNSIFDLLSSIVSFISGTAKKNDRKFSTSSIKYSLLWESISGDIDVLNSSIGDKFFTYKLDKLKRYFLSF